MVADANRILRDKHALLLSFDQGLEHGPKLFDLHTVDPTHVLNIALEGGFTGVVLHAGLAEKYYHGAYTDIPLVIKLNGRTELSELNPFSKQICSVERAVKLGADAVGYTIYDGSPAEPEMFAEFGRICEEAHDYGIPVIAWMYPRGPGVVGRDADSDVIAYAARVGLELGADFVKLKYNHDLHGFEWAVKAAGRAGVLVADNEYGSDEEIIKHAYDVVHAGATGLAYGRSIWQHPRPLTLARALSGILFQNKKPEDVLQYFSQH